MPDSLPIERIPPLPWMQEDSTRRVIAALGGSRCARFVGGAVRDALLGHPILDIDIATIHPPEEAMRRLAAAGIEIAPTGLAHGTITAIAKPRHFEITTLRRDVETDGRHARVAFTDDWAEDAARRDFTMNALFLDLEGNVFDPVGGLADLRAGRVRFVGEPEARIREDVLRLLRFYRFHAHYGRTEADAAARKAARALAPLLPKLSRERVAAELLKLLEARDPTPTLALMREDGVLGIVLPEARPLDRLEALVALEPLPDSIRRLAALIGPDAAAAEEVARRLKLSRAQATRLSLLAAPPVPVELAAGETAQRRALHRLGSALFRDLALLEAAAGRGDAARLSGLLALADVWRPLRFPLKGRDVTSRGIAPGPEVGRLLAAIEAWWESGDFRADRKSCLAELDRRLNRGA